jgi:hypothetical protein
MKSERMEGTANPVSFFHWLLFLGGVHMAPSQFKSFKINYFVIKDDVFYNMQEIENS